MFGIRDDREEGTRYRVTSDMGETMKPEKYDGRDMRWKRPETKADEFAGERWFLSGKTSRQKSDQKRIDLCES